MKKGISIRKLIKEAFMPPYPYEEKTFNFPDNMQKLGYDVKGHDTIVDANAKVMLHMAHQIHALQEQVEMLAGEVDTLKDYSVAGFAHDPLKEGTDGDE